MIFKKGTDDTEEDKMFLPRLGSTILLLLLLGVSVFAPNIYRQNTFYVLLVLMTFALTRELCSILKEIQMPTLDTFLPYFIAFCSMICGLQVFYPTRLIIILILFFFFIFLFLGFWGTVLFTRNSAEAVRKLFNTLTAGMFIMIPVVMIIMIYTLGEGMNRSVGFNLLFLFFILVTKTGDIGAYAVGSLSNKLLKGGTHKMIPSISPGKSWEGMAGGWIFTILLCIFFYYYKGLIASIWAAVVLGTLFYFVGMAGDLAESSMKRAAKRKDSGTTVPGIGGIFDLVDSLLMTAPLFLLVFVLQLIFMRFGLVFFNI